MTPGNGREAIQTQAAPFARGRVASVSLDDKHAFSKRASDRIILLAGLGVDGDAHMGDRVQHRSRIARDPTQPNLRQVHLIHEELHIELAGAGFDLLPGDMGENITTRGIDLLALPKGAQLWIGSAAVIEVTGLRNPCNQLNNFRPGLMNAVLDRAPDGELIRKAGVMAIVLVSGEVRPGDDIEVRLPAGLHQPLQPV